MPHLNRSNAPFERRIGASAPDATGIVHLGLGQFHRAHAAVNTALAMADKGGDWGIVGVANRSRRIIDAMQAQDYLYSILQLSPEGTDVQLVDVHRKLLVAAEQPGDVLAEIADPAHKIITLTITEKGYNKDSATGKLLVGNPDIAASLAGPDTAKAPLAQLAWGLVKRARESQAPVTVLSCDNMQSAGTTTREMVFEFLEAAGVEAPVLDYVTNQVSFPNAMVDRIVPGTNEETKAQVEKILGLRDEAPVPAEQFTMWVLEDHFKAGRPAWEAAGAIFSEEVEKYELVKLRLLNGSHSLISYLGGLSDSPTIPSARDKDFVAESVRAAIYNEYLPSIDLPTGFDPDAYVAQLFHRWQNHALGDKTARVGSDGSAKLLQRIVEPAIRLLDLGEMPHEMALTAASWIACVAPPAGFDPGAIAAEMEEPQREALAKATAGATGVRDHVERIMTGGFFPESLGSRTEFNDRIAELLGIITSAGVEAAANDALGK
ncbi:mannitol dehydrogenase family protein [Brooklawnia cerclae]|uniref:Mannitol-1-phosphate 5-dehydrogenase n=1 Tax=Brooklawnia cerclae TaxID=349934 RepID=A0ABX0SHB8_9ACTN|nr:mannitol dehydrogenase family protein [Brooklawnia cerclae]NIH56151.1 fructuronate reductase [Brooklawnia cerclae]